MAGGKERRKQGKLKPWGLSGEGKGNSGGGGEMKLPPASSCRPSACNYINVAMASSVEQIKLVCITCFPTLVLAKIIQFYFPPLYIFLLVHAWQLSLESLSPPAMKSFAFLLSLKKRKKEKALVFINKIFGLTI